MLRQGHKAVLLAAARSRFVTDQGQDVLVKNLAFAVGQLFETRKSGVGFAFTFQTHAQLLQALFEGIPPTEFAQHNFVVAPTHVFGTHDFVGVTRFEHAVLVDAGGMGKRVGTHHRLVGLHHKTRGLAHHTAGRKNMLRVDVHVQTKIVTAGLHRHHHFFE